MGSTGTMIGESGASEGSGEWYGPSGLDLLGARTYARHAAELRMR